VIFKKVGDFLQLEKFVKFTQLKKTFPKRFPIYLFLKTAKLIGEKINKIK
jgi:hypothetical protein